MKILKEKEFKLTSDFYYGEAYCRSCDYGANPDHESVFIDRDSPSIVYCTACFQKLTTDNTDDFDVFLKLVLKQHPYLSYKNVPELYYDMEFGSGSQRQITKMLNELHMFLKGNRPIFPDLTELDNTNHKYFTDLYKQITGIDIHRDKYKLSRELFIMKLKKEDN